MGNSNFRPATSGVHDSTQIHTYLCYSEFGEVTDLDADVTSIEAVRSHMEVLDGVVSSGRYSDSTWTGTSSAQGCRVTMSATRT